ncbi:DUF6368 family protein [Streptomyces sp. NPDC090798]|uniref:DUF6368 family protein n=1 Tax=Streptomyces sp. NPDC090798 TaxID=3365968 RepID=UPI0037FDFA22
MGGPAAGLWWTEERGALDALPLSGARPPARGRTAPARPRPGAGGPPPARAPRRGTYSHVGDREFLGAWLRHPGFPMVK